MYKVIFIDFDDTLVMHLRTRIQNIHLAKTRANVLFKPLDEAVKIYEHSVVNQDIVDYIKKCSDKDTKVILLTETTNKMLEIKKYYLEQHLPGFIDDYISSAETDTTKCLIIDSYIKEFNIPRNRVLFIDDSNGHLNSIQVEKLGIDLATPQLITFTSHFETVEEKRKAYLEEIKEAE